MLGLEGTSLGKQATERGRQLYHINVELQQNVPIADMVPIRLISGPSLGARSEVPSHRELGNLRIQSGHCEKHNYLPRTWPEENS
jgi:hypothetical protein